MTESETTESAVTQKHSSKEITSTQRVLDAVRDLRELDQIATRETVAELTGLKMGIVDDRLRALVDDGRLKRLLRGIYELVETYPEPRELSCTTLSNGWVKLELGDALLSLTPTEARRAARALGGFAEDARIIESTRTHLFLATELAARVERQARELKAMRALLADKLDTRQLELLGIEGPTDLIAR